MFGSFDLLAGDWGKAGNASYLVNTFMLPIPNSWGKFENIPVAQVEALSVATEENLKKMAGTVGWGLVGGLALGPIGLVAGLLAGGRKKEVTFICKFKDGRKILAKADIKVFEKIQAGCF
ncbi:MAG: hypothetical protein WCF90_08375 [Methanomicrobiales archaeon]